MVKISHLTVIVWNYYMETWCSHFLFLLGGLSKLYCSEKAMAPYSSILAWKISWTEDPGRLQSMGSLRVGHDWSDFTFTFHFHALEKEMATHFSVLAWRIPGTGEPGGLPSMGSHRVGHDWSDLAAANFIAITFTITKTLNRDFREQLPPRWHQWFSSTALSTGLFLPPSQYS